MLNKKGNCDKIVEKKCVLEIDIMNRNTIISLAMLYAVDAIIKVDTEG